MSSSQTHKRPTRAAIVRAVASSTAIETGEDVAAIEVRLDSKEKRSHRVTLAFKPQAQPARS
ncbi:MAG TPA: hypothetical protein PKB14_25580 [Rubrivivax sp.]|nr:hypothetical protein [Rubrivivax sp.]